ncbi:glutamate racemase [Vaginisenegalia massiliensis]|uniref:glutamate racemase n=1 Tax=Vaginisenegalia massiliensis TaxID=2058294 RepID=UPI000F53A66A|nr:glutamate racemase [Vaginisenegalia massiliensis]
MKHLPIGYIDSGFGGLTVVKESLKQLPNESIIFLGDNARCPYGSRPLSEVKHYIWQMAHFLMEKGIKMLVIACNTGTAAALDDLRFNLPIPVVGVIHPGSRAAIKATLNDKIGIIGTIGTVESHLYDEILLEKSDQIEVYAKACPDFVPIVEENRIFSEETKQLTQEYLAEFKEQGIDTLILGCTHYPLMKRVIGPIVGPEVKLIDSGAETISEVSALLDYFNLSRTVEEANLKPASHQFFTTGSAETFAEFAKTWLPIASLEVKSCRIEGEKIIEINHCES